MFPKSDGMPGSRPAFPPPRLEEIFTSGTCAGLGDEGLLARVAGGGPGADAAFEAIVRKHGNTVLGRCMAVLGDRHAAEEAFQATFLLLFVRIKTGNTRIRRSDDLAPWLRGAARNLSLRLRRTLSRDKARLDRFAEASKASPTGPTSDRDALDRQDAEGRRALIAEEVARLPEKLREPIQLWLLTEASQDVMARSLGLKLCTLKKRIEKARLVLKVRLEKRGLKPDSGAYTILLTAGRTTLSVPSPLLATAIRIGRGGTPSATTAALVVPSMLAKAAPLALGMFGVALTLAVLAAYREFAPPAVDRSPPPVALVTRPPVAVEPRPRGKVATHFADVDGDGTADAILINKDNIKVRRGLASGTGFGAEENWAKPGGYDEPNFSWFFADVNGDGKADLVIVDPPVGSIVLRSTGSRFDDADETRGYPVLRGEVGTHFADIDGDGTADAILVNTRNIKVHRGRKGSGLGREETWAEVRVVGLSDIIGALSSASYRRANLWAAPLRPPILLRENGMSHKLLSPLLMALASMAATPDATQNAYLANVYVRIELEQLQEGKGHFKFFDDNKPLQHFGLDQVAVEGGRDNFKIMSASSHQINYEGTCDRLSVAMYLSQDINGIEVRTKVPTKVKIFIGEKLRAEQEVDGIERVPLK